MSITNYNVPDMTCLQSGKPAKMNLFGLERSDGKTVPHLSD